MPLGCGGGSSQCDVPVWLGLSRGYLLRKACRFCPEQQPVAGLVRALRGVVPAAELAEGDEAAAPPPPHLLEECDELYPALVDVHCGAETPALGVRPLDPTFGWSG